MRQFFFSSFFLLSVVFSAQQRISNLNIYQTGSQVTVKFDIEPGPTCYGWDLLHSLDSLNFLVAYSYPNECGQPNGPQSMTGRHESPKRNQMNYYKIELKPYETSRLLSIYVGDNNVFTLDLYPNPVYRQHDELRFRLLSGSNLRLEGKILNDFGSPVRELDLISGSQYTSLDVSTMQNGLYVIWLTDGENLYRGKFIIFH